MDFEMIVVGVEEKGTRGVLTVQTCPAQLRVEAPLNDGEQVLPMRIFIGGDAAVQPAHGAMHGFLHPRARHRATDDVVQLHHDV